ncbi:MAG: CoA-binding protein [Desulfosoma sp.]|uniref:CoA-binding protein n=1 Tax=Desulfosoma sp. TaxID=2603217 RepID=UPI00404B693D
MERLEAIFSPASIAVVGASTVPGKVGHDLFANILRGGYTGVLFPVNPKARSVLSVKAYPTLTDIPDPVELAILVVPPKAALAAVDEAAHRVSRALSLCRRVFGRSGPRGGPLKSPLRRGAVRQAYAWWGLTVWGSSIRIRRCA